MKKLTYIALVIAALGASAGASAKVLTYTVKSNVIANAKGSTAGLDFAKFDTSRGKLQAVQVQLFSDLGTVVSVENTSRKSTSTIVAKAGSVLTFTVTGLTQTLTSSASHTFNEAIFDGTNDFGGTSGGVFSFNTPFSSSASYTGANTLALFSGAGNLHAGLTGVSNSLVTGLSGNTRSLVVPAFDGYAKVTYVYAVPEPETYALMLAGLSLIGVVRRRRKSV